MDNLSYLALQAQDYLNKRYGLGGLLPFSVRIDRREGFGPAVLIHWPGDGLYLPIDPTDYLLRPDLAIRFVLLSMAAWLEGAKFH